MARVWFLALSAALTAACSSAALPPSAPSPLLGKPVPDFARPTLSGERVATAELRGSPVVLKFFAEYCKPCVRTLPAAERLHRQHPDVTFVGISADEYAATARAVAETYGLSFALVHDAGGALQGRFRVSELPVTFVVDSRGTVRWVGGPAQSERELAEVLRALRDQG
jgi:cytochrome c biogenesis protein CcmG, thiol:disulfide interchange protein DsbE